METFKGIKSLVQTPDPDLPALRKNKSYINKLLASNWTILSAIEKEIFFMNEKYFLAKSLLMQSNGDISKRMIATHANVKVLADDPDKKQRRAALMLTLSQDDKLRAKQWKEIDTWNEKDAAHPIHPIQSDAQQLTAAAVVDMQKVIQRNTVYISRAKSALRTMPGDTAKQLQKIDNKELQVRKRKAQNAQLRSTLNAINT